MRFMIIRKADAETESETDAMPPVELLEAMGEYNQSMIDAGVMIDGAGLRPSSYGFRFSFENGEPTIIDGPFAEAKELIAGFTIIEVASPEEAIEWVKKWPKEDGHGNVQLELRRLYEMEDFADTIAQSEKYAESGFPEIQKQEN
jgi:PhnB protein